MLSKGTCLSSLQMVGIQQTEAGDSAPQLVTEGKRVRLRPPSPKDSSARRNCELETIVRAPGAVRWIKLLLNAPTILESEHVSSSLSGFGMYQACRQC